MCDLMEEYFEKRYNETVQKADKIAVEYALALLQHGVSLQDAAEKTQLPLERVQKLAQEQEDKH